MLIGIDASRANRERRSGIENYSLQMILALIRVDKANTYRLFTREAPIKELQHLPATVAVKVVETHSRFAKMRQRLHLPQMWTHTALRAELKAAPVDVLFVPGHVLPRGYQGKSVWTCHDIGWRYIPGAYGWLEKLYLDRSTRQCATQASKIVADSIKTRQDLETLFGVSANKIQVVYPGYNAQLYKPSDQLHRALLKKNFDLESPYLFYVGNLVPKKNLEVVIEAFSIVMGRIEQAKTMAELKVQSEVAIDENVHSYSLKQEFLASLGGTIARLQLVMAGQGSPRYVQKLKDFAAKMLVGKHLKLLGYISDSEVADLMSFALAYVQPSYYEGFGMPVVEAMACGAPVVVSDGGSLLEIGGEAGLSFHHSDAAQLADIILKLATNATTRDKMSQDSRQFVTRFNWDKSAEEILQIFATL